MKIKVLSLFNGISCGQIALDRAGVVVDKYYASEIDKYAIGITHKNYPNTIQLGDVYGVKGYDLPKIDLIIGGNPCQSFSFCGKQLNFSDPRGMLFFEFIRVLKECKPKYFLLENVVMKKEYQDIFTEYLNSTGIPGIHMNKINSSLVSGQNRERLYWSNIPYKLPIEDKGILLKNIVLKDAIFENGTSCGGGHIPLLLLSENALAYMDRTVTDGRTHWDFQHHSDVRDPKSRTVVANFYKGVPYNVLKDWNCIRYFDCVEVERLQTVPDDYTKTGIVNGKEVLISNTQRMKCLGNGWTVDVIAWIFKFLVF